MNQLQPRSSRRLRSSQLDQNDEKYQGKYDILANTKAENMPRRGSKRVGNNTLILFKNGNSLLIKENPRDKAAFGLTFLASGATQDRA